MLHHLLYLNCMKVIYCLFHWCPTSIVGHTDRQVIVPTVPYGAKTWVLREAERLRLNVYEKCLKPMEGVKRGDRVRNDEIWKRARIDETLAEKVNSRVLRRFGHVARKDEGV